MFPETLQFPSSSNPYLEENEDLKFWGSSFREEPHTWRLVWEGGCPPAAFDPSDPALRMSRVQRAVHMSTAYMNPTTANKPNLQRQDTNASQLAEVGNHEDRIRTW